MADRKVLVKYYPPDFDPDKLREKSRQYRHVIQKKKKTGSIKQMNVRFMFPFTMCCGTCGEFIYIGTKFNSRVERAMGEDYLGIAIWRFYARCPHCRAEIAFKTDPKNTEYVLEFGGTRTYDPKKDAELAASTLKDQLEEEIGTDSIKALEHKTYSTANELMALEQLDELRKINKRLLNRESMVDDALEWLKLGGMEKPEDNKTNEEKFDSDEMADFEKARDEISQRQLDSAFAEQNSDNDDRRQENALGNNDDAIADSSSSSSSTLLNSKPFIKIKKRTTQPLDFRESAVKRSIVNESQIGVSLLGSYNSISDQDSD